MTFVRKEAPPGCDNCAAYTNTIRTLLDDWATAGCPQNPSTYSAQIGAALAMYCEHIGEHLPA